MKLWESNTLLWWKQIWGGARDEEIPHLLKKYKNKHEEEVLAGN